MNPNLMLTGLPANLSSSSILVGSDPINVKARELFSDIQTISSQTMSYWDSGSGHNYGMKRVLKAFEDGSSKRISDLYHKDKDSLNPMELVIAYKFNIAGRLAELEALTLIQVAQNS